MAISHVIKAGKKKTKANAGNPKVLALAHDPPSDRLVCFTDGSAIPNPGPSGAGIHYHLPGNERELSVSIALGDGDNNLGEMVGLGIAICLAGHFKTPTPLIFSDSLSAIYYLTAGWPHPTNKSVCRATRRALRRLPTKHRPRLYWIRGHTSITGNELADKLAKKGAKYSKSRNLPRPLATYSIDTPDHIKIIIDDFLNYMYDELPP